MTSVQRNRRLSLIVPALVVSVAALAGCSSNDDKQPASDPTAVLTAAKTQLDETSGLNLSLHTDKNLPDGVDGVLDATGVGTHAPAFEGSIKVLYNGLTVDVPVVAVDGKVYAKIPFSGPDFAEINPADYGAPDPAGLMDPATGVSNWLVAATGVKKGAKTRDGDQVLTEYTGTLPGKDVASVIPSADDTAEFPVTFLINDDGQLVSTDVSGPFYGDKGTVDYTLDLSDYGTEKDIQAP